MITGCIGAGILLVLTVIIYAICLCVKKSSNENKIRTFREEQTPVKSGVKTVGGLVLVNTHDSGSKDINQTIELPDGQKGQQNEANQLDPF